MFSLYFTSTIVFLAPVNLVVEDAHDQNGDDGRGQERVDDDAVRVPPDESRVHPEFGEGVLRGTVHEFDLERNQNVRSSLCRKYQVRVR